ncbi:ANKRD50 [Symbiodinium microadriaticum]|nr:ANKRD50 [Symbiodinium microadriaticum]
MTKLSLALKQENALADVCRALPSAWPKLRKTSKLYMWRLDELKLHTLQQTLIEDLNLVFADLFELCERGDSECVWILLSQGMNPKQRDPEGATLLQKATHSGSVTILKLLVEKGGVLNAKGSYGYTPLHEACYLGNPEVCEVLLSVKANVDALSKNGSTPLLVAAREGHNAICESLLKHHADADDGGDKGWTPLSVAAGEGHVGVCETLLKYNANVHGFAADGRCERSALQEAAEQGHANVVGLLLESKADVHHTFDEGGGQNRRWTAAELAERAGHSKIVHMLMSQDVSSETDGSVELETPSGTATTAELGPDGLPSIGSIGHATGDCKRCCFHPKGRCQNGHECRFCHFDHDKRRRAGVKKKGSRQLSPDSSMTGSGDGTSPVLTPAMGQQPMALIPGPQAPCQQMQCIPGALPPVVNMNPYDVQPPHVEAPPMTMGCMDDQVGFAPSMMPSDYGNMPMWQSEHVPFPPLSTAPQGQGFHPGWGPPNFYAGHQPHQIPPPMPFQPNCPPPMGPTFNAGPPLMLPNYTTSAGRPLEPGVQSSRGRGTLPMANLGDVSLLERFQALSCNWDSGDGRGCSNSMEACWITSCQHVLCDTHAKASFASSDVCPVCGFQGAKVIRASLGRDSRAETKKRLLPGLAPSEIMDAAGRNLEFWVRQKALESSRRRIRCSKLEERLANVTKTAEEHIQQSQKQQQDLAAEEVELEKRLQMLDKECAEVGHQIEALKREFMEADEQRSRLDLQVGGSVQEVLRGFPGPGRGAGASLPRPSQPAGLSYSFEGSGAPILGATAADPRPGLVESRRAQVTSSPIHNLSSVGPRRYRLPADVIFAGYRPSAGALQSFTALGSKQAPGTSWRATLLRCTATSIEPATAARRPAGVELHDQAEHG